MSDLKPCLCGSDKVHFGYEPFCGLTFWRVMCDTCGTQTSTFDTKEEAAEKWNTRPGEDSLKAEIERLKETIKEIRNIADKGLDMGIDFIGAGLDGMTGGVEDWQGMKRAKRKIRKLAKQALKKTTNAPDTNVGTMEEN